MKGEVKTWGREKGKSVNKADARWREELPSVPILRLIKGRLSFWEGEEVT